MASKINSGVEIKEDMKNITINLQEDYIKFIEDLVAPVELLDESSEPVRAS